MPGPTVAACQCAVADLDVDANLAALGERLAGLPDDVDLACFPEYFLTGFVADDRVERVALARDGPTVGRVADAAAAHDCAVLVGFVEEAPDDGALYNTLCYVAPDGNRAFYRKRHRWGGEADVLAAGEEAAIVDAPVGRAGLVTCYDLNFVEVSAAFARERVDALLVAGAWPAAHSDNWELLLRARALDGVRWVVGVGRTGRRDLPSTPAVEYAAHSRVVRPDGSVKCGLNRDERDLVATLDPDVLAERREFIPVLDGE